MAIIIIMMIKKNKKEYSQQNKKSPLYEYKNFKKRSFLKPTHQHPPPNTNSFPHIAISPNSLSSFHPPFFLSNFPSHQHSFTPYPPAHKHPFFLLYSGLLLPLSPSPQTSSFTLSPPHPHLPLLVCSIFSLSFLLLSLTHTHTHPPPDLFIAPHFAATKR